MTPALAPQNPLNHVASVIDRHQADLKKPGVINVQPGYKMENDWPTKQPAIVVIKSQGAADIALPSAIEGIPVDVREATPVEELRHSDPARFAKLASNHAELATGAFEDILSGTEEEAPVEAEAEAAKPQLAYTPAAKPLTAVSGALSFVCHASPDAGWPTLKKFLAQTHSTLTIGLYDFTSKHILDSVETALASGQKLEITLDNPSLNPTADQSDSDTLKTLGADLGEEFRAAWALVRSNKDVSQWIFPTAYHIKVAVQDSKSLWLSSGNWNNSNQPDMDPIGHPQPTDQATAKKSDRDWHVIINNKDLAGQFESYLKHDNEVAQTIAPAGPGTLALEPPALMPADFQPAAAPVAWKFFAPLVLENEETTITPLLTPDAGVYQPAMLALIESATAKLFIQLQYIHPSDKPEDADFEALISAVAKKIQDGVDVRIITSQFQTSGGWLDRLQAAGIDLAHVKIQNGVHNKGFVVDSKRVALGSQNWSGDGVLRNRDASVIIDNAKAAAYYEQIFLHDWNNVAKQSVHP